MGRKKIPIEKIENVKNRAVTFRKRRHGFFKKATELSKLCDVDVSIVISNKTKPGAFEGTIDQESPIITYSSTNLQQHLKSFLDYRAETVHFDADLQDMKSISLATTNTSKSPKPTEGATTDTQHPEAISCNQTTSSSAVSMPAKNSPVFEVLRPIPKRMPAPMKSSNQIVGSQPMIR